MTTGYFQRAKQAIGRTAHVYGLTALVVASLSLGTLYSNAIPKLSSQDPTRVAKLVDTPASLESQNRINCNKDLQNKLNQIHQNFVRAGISSSWDTVLRDKEDGRIIEKYPTYAIFVDVEGKKIPLRITQAFYSNKPFWFAYFVTQSNDMAVATIMPGYEEAGKLVPDRMSIAVNSINTEAEISKEMQEKVFEKGKQSIQKILECQEKNIPLEMISREFFLKNYDQSKNPPPQKQEEINKKANEILYSFLLN